MPGRVALIESSSSIARCVLTLCLGWKVLLPILPVHGTVS
jgi:hypothetical protein